jgi:hypothetical protein
MPTKQKNPTASKRLPRKLVITIIVTVALAAVLFALLGYRAQETRKSDQQSLADDRAAFAQIEADMARTYDVIVAATGKPQEESMSKNCSRISHKYEEGELFCGVTYIARYNPAEDDGAQELKNAIEQAVVKAGEFSITDKHQLGGEDESISELFLVNANADSCKLRMQISSITENKQLELSLSCDKQSKQAVYTEAQ